MVQAQDCSLLACSPEYLVKRKLCPCRETPYLQKWRQPMRSMRPVVTMATLVATLTKMLVTPSLQQVQSPHHG